jgi:hypothetical protein
VTGTTRIDVLLATLNAADVGSLETITEKLGQVRRELESLGGDVGEFQRGRAFLQSKIGHLR